jgi:L-rhamnose isomerase/sugar isomerase
VSDEVPGDGPAIGPADDGGAGAAEAVGAGEGGAVFRILHEVVRADALVPREAGGGGASTPGGDIAFMLDQCHNIEPKIPGEIRSVMNVQEATAKALLVDEAALAAAQQAQDVLGANAVLMDAYNTDVRPLLAEVRQDLGLDPDPYRAYLATDYQQHIIANRVGGTPASWGS